MTKWRWDQGRIQYFAYPNLRLIASTLVRLNGASLGPSEGDTLRATLEAETGLDFLPSHYAVWRNYGRVFKLALLAAKVGNHLECTDLCRQIASATDFGVDQYLSVLAQRTYFPSPALERYSPSRDRVFPFCVVLKLLLTRPQRGGLVYLTVDEVLEIGIANGLTGREPLARFASASRRPHRPTSDEARQVRELLRVLSQMSFLKWDAGRLYLDSATITPEQMEALSAIAEPVVQYQNPDPAREILSLGREGSPVDLPLDISADESSFAEGRKVRVTHLRTERSTVLRRRFFDQRTPPHICEMCDLMVSEKYPWTKNLLDLHHLLPFSSGITAGPRNTQLTDLVAICPTCHRATHQYYSYWLKSRSLDDFPDAEAARSVYEEAKAKVN